MPSNCLAFVHQSNSSVQTSFIIDNEGFVNFLSKVFCFPTFQQSTVQIADHEVYYETHSWDNFEECEGVRSHSRSSKMRPCTLCVLTNCFHPQSVYIIRKKHSTNFHKWLFLEILAKVLLMVENNLHNLTYQS